MTFDLVPADLILKIFHQLPFKDRVRLSGVNRLFREVSEISINTMRSLEINDDLLNYTIMTQPFPSLLESCSPILESIDVTNPPTNKWMLNALAEFVYPKLDHLEIKVTNDEVAKKLIRRNRNLRSIFVYLNRETEFEWPEDIVLENLESLEIYSCGLNLGLNINLSPTLRPLIGKVPNLKYLTIQRGNVSPVFKLPVQVFSQLLATTPCLQELKLPYIECRSSVSIDGDFEAAISTWHLPNLTSLGDPYPPTILHNFPISFPRLYTFRTNFVITIDDQAMVALSQLEQLRELDLDNLSIMKDKFIDLIKALPSIVVLGISGLSQWLTSVDDQVILALSQLQYLRELRMPGETLSKEIIIDLVTNIPSLSILNISMIVDAQPTPDLLIDFLTSTAALFHRNLDIRIRFMYVNINEVELEQLKARLEEVKISGGPVVEMKGCYIRSIRYSL